MILLTKGIKVGHISPVYKIDNCHEIARIDVEKTAHKSEVYTFACIVCFL